MSYEQPIKPGGNGSALTAKLGFVMNERYSKALHLKKLGKTNKEISIELNCSVARAREIVKSAQIKYERRIKDFDGLPERVINCFRYENIRDKKTLLERLSSGKIYPFFTPNYGVKSHESLIKWLESETKT